MSAMQRSTVSIDPSSTALRRSSSFMGGEPNRSEAPAVVGSADASCSASTRAPPASRPRCSTSGSQPVREARRDKRQPPPAARAGSSRTARRSSRPSSRRSPSCSQTRRGEVVACGLDHQGESVLAWDAETGKPLTPDRRLAGQALAGGARPAGRRHEEEIRALSGLPFDPYFSAAKLAWLLEHDEAVAAGARGGHAAHGHRRLVPVRPPGRRVRHRQLDRLAHAAAPARHAGLRRSPVRAVRRAAGGAARGARHGGRARHAPPRGLDGRPPAVRAGGGPAGRPGRRRLRRARPREGHLRDRRVRARPRGRPGAPAPPAGSSPRSPGASAAGWSTRSTAEFYTAGAMLEWMCRELGMAEEPGGAHRAGARCRGQRRGARAPRAWRAWGRPGGSRMRAP